ncbi:MAG TPA: response regulator [Polyangiaceae bacterium]
MLDTVARRIEELSVAVMVQTERLLERPNPRQPPDEDLASILDAARRSSELARELVVLARRERDAAAAALSGVTRSEASSEPPRESEPAFSHRRVRTERERESEQRTVLLVEDEPLLLKAMYRMLEQYHYRVLPAPTAVAALGVAEKERSIDLVVTDLVLPGMTGSALVKRLRATRPWLRVLYTSGWDPASSGVSLRSDGSEAFLGKPFTAAELDTALTELLGPPTVRVARQS